MVREERVGKCPWTRGPGDDGGGGTNHTGPMAFMLTDSGSLWTALSGETQSSV